MHPSGAGRILRHFATPHAAATSSSFSPHSPRNDQKAARPRSQPVNVLLARSNVQTQAQPTRSISSLLID
jgi:hypothetical protein